MNAKLVFETMMSGDAQLHESLERTLKQLNDISAVGSQAGNSTDKMWKSIVEGLGKTQAGPDGLLKTFENYNKQSSEFISKAHKNTTDSANREFQALEDRIGKLMTLIKNANTDIGQMNGPAGLLQSAISGVSTNTPQGPAGMLPFTAAGGQPPQGPAGMVSPVGGPPSGGGMNLDPRTMVGIFSALAGAPMTLGQGLTQMGAAGVRQEYTKEIDSYLAQRRLTLGAAESAQKGDVTVSLLKGLGLGLENEATKSSAYQQKLMGQQIANNPWAQALAGMGMGAIGGLAGGAFFGGVGAIPGAIIGGIGGGISGYLHGAANEKTKEQIDAENKAIFRAKDAEMYGIAGDQAGANFKRESNELDSGQRAFGMEATHRAVMGLARTGVSMDRGNPILSAMIAQGMNPNDFTGQFALGRGGGGGSYTENDLSNFIKSTNIYGFSGKATSAALRAQALGGGTMMNQTNSMLSVMSGAGLTSASSTAARGTFSEAVAGLQAGHGGTEMAAGNVGAGLAGAVGANAAGFNKVEGVQQGISIYNDVNKKLESGNSLLAMAMISKLRGLGVVDAVAIDVFMKMGLTLPSTHEAIAKYIGGGMTKEKVAEALVAGFKISEGAIGAAFGKSKLARLSAATGHDVTTLIATGDVKAFENTSNLPGVGGAKYGESGAGMFSGKGAGAPGLVVPGEETQKDKEDAAKAKQQVSTDEAMRAMLDQTGKTVTAAISQSIIEGFLLTAKEVEKVGVNLQQKRVDDAAKAKKGEEAINKEMKDAKLYPGPKMGQNKW